LVADRQVDQVEAQIQDAREKGATILCGGSRPEGLKGAYYEPTLITNITKDMKVWKEEVFGPVLIIIGFDKYEEAIALANDTMYGLSGFVFTQDSDLAKKSMRDIGAGSLQQNTCNYQRPQNPFGGYKASGIGRQRGFDGFRNVCQVKVIAWQK
jgi:acyl-CoA reductase-like NAD-dependent aldehyde dehydrogenase